MFMRISLCTMKLESEASLLLYRGLLEGTTTPAMRICIQKCHSYFHQNPFLTAWRTFLSILRLQQGMMG